MRGALPPAQRLHDLPNGRLVPFGPGLVMLAMPLVNDVPALQRAGVRWVVSEESPDRDTRQAMLAAGMAHIELPVNSTFRAPTVDSLLQAARGGVRLAIHCMHGVDRTGASTALVLHCVYGVPIGRALAAVVAPGETDRRNLRHILDQEAPGEWAQVRPSEIGIYSGAGTGGSGGMKVRLGEGYETLVRTAIRQARRCRRAP